MQRTYVWEAVITGRERSSWLYRLIWYERCDCTQNGSICRSCSRLVRPIRSICLATNEIHNRVSQNHVLYVGDNSDHAQRAVRQLQEKLAELSVRATTQGELGETESPACVVSVCEDRPVDTLERIRSAQPTVPVVLVVSPAGETTDEWLQSANRTDIVRTDDVAADAALLAHRIRVLLDNANATPASDADGQTRFETLFENPIHPLVETEFVDQEPIITRVNGAFEEVFGYEEATVRGDSLDEWVVSPDQQDEATEINDRVLDGEPFSMEVTRQTADGPREFLLHNVAHPEMEGEFAMYTDITERKERERELRYRTTLLEALTESIDAGVLLVSPDREILFYNSQFREMWNLPQSVLEEPDDNQRAIEHVLDMLANPTAFVEATKDIYEPPYEAAHRKIELADGRWFDRYTAPVTGEEGLYGLLTITRDITEQKQYERRIETQNRRLERLAGVISHDLQTPLSTAKKHLTLLELELDDPDEPVAQSLADLETTMDRVEQFAEHLPRLARESTNVEAPEACSLSTVAERAWAVTDTGALSLEFDGDCSLQADPRRLQQLFENLFANAVEHATETPDGQPAATTVRVGTHDSGFYIADDGPGVADQQGEEIFNYGMTTGGGTGIGLAIVRSIVEAHGWSIRVDDAADGGAMFCIDTQ